MENRHTTNHQWVCSFSTHEKTLCFFEKDKYRNHLLNVHKNDFPTSQLELLINTSHQTGAIFTSCPFNCGSKGGGGLSGSKKNISTGKETEETPCPKDEQALLEHIGACMLLLAVECFPPLFNSAYTSKNSSQILNSAEHPSRATQMSSQLTIDSSQLEPPKNSWYSPAVSYTRNHSLQIMHDVETLALSPRSSRSTTSSTELESWGSRPTSPSAFQDPFETPEALSSVDKPSLDWDEILKQKMNVYTKLRPLYDLATDPVLDSFRVRAQQEMEYPSQFAEEPQRSYPLQAPKKYATPRNRYSGYISPADVQGSWPMVCDLSASLYCSQY